MEELETPPLNEVPGESAGTPELSDGASVGRNHDSHPDSGEVSGGAEAASAGPRLDGATEAAENEGMVAAVPENDGAAASGSDELSGDLEATQPESAATEAREVAAATEPSEAASAESSDDGATEAAENEGMVAGVPENDGTAASGSDELSGDSEATEPSEAAPAVSSDTTAELADQTSETGTPSVEDLFAETQQAAPLVEDAQLRAVLEAIIYVAEEPLTLAQLAAALHEPAGRIRGVLEQLAAEYNKPEHGITVREVAGGYKMGTKPEHHEGVRSFVKSLKPPLKLSLPALETLAVIAYKQPVTAPEIMEIRGVQGTGVLKTLLDRKLIAVAGRKNVIGKPILYKSTKEFLIQFGLKDMSELPSLKEFEEIRRMALSEPEAPAPAPVTPAPAAPAAETGGESPEPAADPPAGQES